MYAWVEGECSRGRARRLPVAGGGAPSSVDWRSGRSFRPGQPVGRGGLRAREHGMDEAKTAAPTGAHLLLATLQARGTRHLFGVPGHGAYPIYNALCDFPTLTPIVGRH